MSRPASGPSERARAARILVDVLHRNKTLDQTFGRDEPSPFLQELVYGTVRHFYALDAMVAAELDHPIKRRDLDVRCLMLAGAYQLHFMRIPDYAAINETVSACRALNKPWARGVVNAILRKVAKRELTERSYELPDWVAGRFDTAYPEHAEALKVATLERAPMSLRVNTLKTNPQDYGNLLADHGIPVVPGWLPENLVLEQPLAARSLPGYPEGLVSIQDAGALFAAPLTLEAAMPKRILDACAAPGGKLFHLAERAPGATLTGLELSEARLEHLQAEAKRLGHTHVRLLRGDAGSRDWHDGAPFDAILLDAPCSGSGTLRRHPEIKLLRQPSDLTRYAELQDALLSNLFQLLAPEGTFLYCTCSLFTEENDDVIAAFLDREPHAVPLPVELPTGIPTRYGWQLLPLPADPGTPNRTVDGFYFARLARRGML